MMEYPFPNQNDYFCHELKGEDVQHNNNLENSMWVLLMDSEA
jgi:hypothetical protein